MRRLVGTLLTVAIVLTAAPARAATYTPVLNFSLHGNLTFRVLQDSKVIEEAYDYNLDRNFVFGHMQANKPFSFELGSGGKSALWEMAPKSTDECFLKVGIGLASGRILEEDPARWLGEIPLEITWEEDNRHDWQPLYYWRASASGQVAGPAISDVGVYDKLLFHVVCSGLVLDTFQFTFSGGVVAAPKLPVPILTLKNNVAKVDLGDFEPNDYSADVRLVFYECEEETSGCKEFGKGLDYLSGQIKGPLEFNVTGLTGPYFNVWVGMGNEYGVSSEFSNSILVSGTSTKKYTAPTFKGLATKLTSIQKSKIKTQVVNFAGLKKVTCTAYVLAGQSLTEKTRAEVRAKNACLYAKSVVKGAAISYKTAVTKTKSNLGKVQIQLSN